MTLLNKPGKPTDEEWTLLKAHPAHGAEMAAALLPWLAEWGAVIVEHHERYDGTGYPTGIAGAQISLGARIVSVADAYDVMTAARAYQRPVSRAAALAELVRLSGSQFDPAVVRAMVAVGAPRLRRAQGLVSWLADVPLVATGAVPAATVARVVGAGALATGAVTAGLPAAHSAVEPPVRPASSASASAEHRPGGSAGSGQASASVPVAADRLPTTSPTDRGSVGPEQPTATALPTAAPTSATPDSGPPVDPAPGAPSATTAAADPETVPTSTPMATASPKAPSSPTDPSSPKPTSSPTPVKSTGPVGQVVDDTVGTVGGVVDGVTGTVDDVVTDPVGTVTRQDPLGTVGTILGGTSSGSPSPSPSPTATKSGLLGGILRR